MKLRLFPKKVRILFSLFLFFSFCIATAQAQKTVTGTVLSSEDNTPLPGASVVEKGTNNGTSTDFDGKFSLNVASNATIIVASYIGYVNQEVTITGSELTITLQVDANALDEVIVVGYGTLKKSDLVSAVEKVDLEKAFVTPTADINEMLRGRIAGLKVDVGGGSLRPGGSSEIFFRGIRSILGKNTAVYVVDGVLREGGIEDINSDDIKSVEFLKDASAQAIYGSKGVNGVVLITTKRGTNNKVSVSYHGFAAVKSVKKNFEVYNGQEFAQLRREAHRANNPNDEFEAEDFVFTSAELTSLNNNEFINWEDELLETGEVNSHSISISGGTDLTKVYGSLSYFKENGLVPSSSFTRKNLRLNIDQKISKKVSAVFDVSLINSDLDQASSQVNVITISPLGKVRDATGELVQYPNGDQGGLVNPLWNIREAVNTTKGNDFVVTVIPKVQFTDNLQYQLKASVTRKNSERGQYLSSLHSSGQSSNGIARIDNILREAFLIENILTYDKQLNDDHYVNITLVQAIDENKFSRTFVEGRDFLNEDNGFNGISSALTVSPVVRGLEKRRTASFMGRARYNFMDKYLLTATMRADGASVNSEDNKWTYNPAFAVAWKIHSEDFLKDVEAIDQLKLRVSYGSLANALTSPLTSLFTAGEQLYVFDNESASGFAPSTVLPNPNLKHEVTTTFNIGIDFNLFQNLLVGSLEYYKSKTTDLLLNKSVPTVSGFDKTFFNAGEVENKGIELSLTANIINKDDFKWSVSTSFSNNKNELIDLAGRDENGDLIFDSRFGYYPGQALNSLLHFQFDGIWQEGEDFANSPQANPDSSTPRPNLRAGDIRIKDTNGRDDATGRLTGLPDGKITDDDRIFTDRNPDWFGSFSTTVSYKGFELFADIYVSQGATGSNPFLADFNNGGSLQGKLNGVKVPYYTPENPSTSFPRPSFETAPIELFTLTVKDASYVRLRTLTLGYTLPNVKKVDYIKLYVTATNLFTITDYLGYSPEVNIRNTFSSADTGYPDASGFTFGLKIKL